MSLYHGVRCKQIRCIQFRFSQASTKLPSPAGPQPCMPHLPDARIIGCCPNYFVGCTVWPCLHVCNFVSSGDSLWASNYFYYDDGGVWNKTIHNYGTSIGRQHCDTRSSSKIGFIKVDFVVVIMMAKVFLGERRIHRKPNY